MDRSILGPRPFIETNVTGTLNLLTVARERSAGADRRRLFLHVSTDEVYGSLGARARPDRTSRLRTEQPLCRVESRLRSPRARLPPHLRLPAITTHCSNNYGPFQFPEKLIPLMVLTRGRVSRCPCTATACKFATGWESKIMRSAAHRARARYRRRDVAALAAATSGQTSKSSRRSAMSWTRASGGGPARGAS